MRKRWHELYNPVWGEGLQRDYLSRPRRDCNWMQLMSDLHKWVGLSVSGEGLAGEVANRCGGESWCSGSSGDARLTVRPRKGKRCRSGDSKAVVSLCVTNHLAKFRNNGISGVSLWEVPLIDLAEALTADSR
ncbi:hydroxyacid dehydrogenase [Sesbania bispinosa]|nr:hydroxyacid dehydrogenase [Sesbania bispinosa]